MNTVASALPPSRAPAAGVPSKGAWLQRKCACGAAKSSTFDERCDQCKSRVPQKKLVVGASDDALEREADRVADQVLAAPSRPPDVGAAPMRIQRLASAPVDGVPASVVPALASASQPLEPALRRDMEQRFGHDFSRVRVHCGAAADRSTQALHARAYTVGHDIVFGSGSYTPATAQGRQLLAHELTHVVQQAHARRMADGPGAGPRGGARVQEPVTAAGAAPQLRAKPQDGSPKAKDKPKVPQICGRRSRKVAGNSITKVTLDVGANTLEIEWQDKTKVPAGGAGTHAISPGAGLCCVDCNDDTVSQASGKLCTPKGGAWAVSHLGCELGGHPSAKNPSYFQRGGIAIHSGNTGNPPQSHGCSRTSLEMSELIHDNVVPGQTMIASSGTWTGGRCYLTENAKNLSSRKDVCDGFKLKPKDSGKKGRGKKAGLGSEPNEPLNAGLDALDEAGTLAEGGEAEQDFEGLPALAADGPGPNNTPIAHEIIGEVPDDELEIAEAEPRTLQAKSSLGDSRDPLEQEADRIADQVTAKPVNSASSGGRQALHCQSISTAAASTQAWPASVERALASAGAPLDTALRADLEPRFGFDFSRVRLHADPDAARSARDVHAHAYTVGQDIVLGADRPSTGTPAHRWLMAHELTHVVQQSQADEIRAPHGSPAQGREPVAAAAGVTRSVAPHLARFEPSPQYMPPPMTRPPPGLRPSPGTLVPETGPRYATEPGSGDFYEMYEREKQAPDCEGVELELAIPVATLDRGGKAPDFVTEGPNRKLKVQNGHTFCDVVYTPRALHILEAIEYRVKQATNAEHLKDVLERYINDRKPTGPFPPFIVPPDLDPGGVVRVQAYTAAVNWRQTSGPRLDPAHDPTLVLPEDLPAQARQKGCSVTPGRGLFDPRFEPPFDNWMAATYCQQVTGSLFEYRVTAPNGTDYAIYDGKKGSVVYECKCGYESIRDVDSDNPKKRARAEQKLIKILRQMDNHLLVAKACGLGLTYKVSSAFLAQALRTASADAAVDHARIPGFPTESCEP